MDHNQNNKTVTALIRWNILYMFLIWYFFFLIEKIIFQTKKSPPVMTITAWHKVKNRNKVLIKIQTCYIRHYACNTQVTNILKYWSIRLRISKEPCRIFIYTYKCHCFNNKWQYMDDLLKIAKEIVILI